MLPFVGVPPQKMLGFVRLFSPFSGTAPPPLAQSFPPLQYRFEAFFLCSSFVRCAERAAFQTHPLQDAISNAILAAGFNFKSAPVVKRDLVKTHRQTVTIRHAFGRRVQVSSHLSRTGCSHPQNADFLHASPLVRLSTSRQNRKEFHAIIRAHSSSWGTLSEVARCDKLIWG